MESLSGAVNLWQAGLLLLLFLLVWMFFRSLNLGDRFRQRQEIRMEQNLERKRNEVAAEASRAILKKAAERAPEVKKP
jgi:hypothetical protein